MPVEKAFETTSSSQVTKPRNSLDELILFKSRLRDIPGAEPCYACEKPTRRTYVDYDYSYEINETTSLTIAKKLPGYRCKDCDINYYNPDLTHRFTNLVGEILADLGYDSLKRNLNPDPSIYTISGIPQEILDRLNSKLSTISIIPS